MPDTGSSPFVERPGNILNDDSEYNLKQVISNLQFQLSSAKTEKNLLEQGKSSLAEEYEKVISKKNEELTTLQEDVKFLYKQREELQSKIENQAQIHEQQCNTLKRDIDNLTQSHSKKISSFDRIEFKYNNVVGKYEHVKSDYNYELQINDQLRERIESLQEKESKLLKLNDDLSENLRLAANQLANDKSQYLQLQNDNLKKTNNQLQLKVDDLLQNKTSVELLKQQNISLMNKASRLEEYEQKYLSISIENSILKTKFDDYFKIINEYIKHDGDDTNESIVLKFVNKFKELRNSNIVLLDKIAQTQLKLTQTEEVTKTLQGQIENDLYPQMNLLKEECKSKIQTIAKLESQKSLNVKEIEFLRSSLKKFDELDQKKTNDVSSEATNQYLTNLEKLVDEYKNEIDKLQKNLQSQSSQNNEQSESIGDKRPRIIDDAMKVKLSSSNVKSLESENLELLTKIETLSEEILRLNQRNKSLEQINTRRESFHVLQYKSNPFNKDQLVKQVSLDLLRKENEDLIKSYVENKSCDVDQIPKSVFARQEQDKEILQTKIDQLMKKINRLKSIYSDKSKDILSIISKYFGYSIEFVPNPVNPNDLSSRIKLVSRYLNKNSANNGYLILDLNTKSLKANGNSVFKNLCEDLVAKWVNEKGQIPCFLSALNLKIFETNL